MFATKNVNFKFRYFSAEPRQYFVKTFFPKIFPLYNIHHSKGADTSDQRTLVYLIGHNLVNHLATLFRFIHKSAVKILHFAQGIYWIPRPFIFYLWLVKIKFWPTCPESICKQFFLTGSLLQKKKSTIFIQFWLPHLGGGAWVIETHVIIFLENQDIRCQKSSYNRFGD